MVDETGIQSSSPHESLPGLFAFPARVLRVRDSDALLKLARAAAHDPEAIDGAEPFFWPAEVSSTRLDSYSTHMLRSTLKNFAEDLNAGVSFQNSHNTRELGFGRSVAGQYHGGTGKGLATTVGDFMTVPGLNLNGVTTDDLIRGIRTGLIVDHSVGFYGGQWLCDIDGRDMMQWGECPHFPGLTYDVDGKQVLATAGVDNARLAEVSAVFDGSTPGAGVLKARHAAEAGLLVPEIARSLEVCYRIKLPASHHTWGGFDPKQVEDNRMPDTVITPTGTPPPVAERSPELTAMLTRAREVVGIEVAAGAAPPTDEAVMERLLAQAGRVPALDARVAELGPQAEDGKAYRAAMVDATWTEYVRAGLAEGVVEADQRALWATAPLPQVIKEQGHYRKLGDARFGGGRQTTEGEPASNGKRELEIPVEAYRTPRR